MIFDGFWWFLMVFGAFSTVFNVLGIVFMLFEGGYGGGTAFPAKARAASVLCDSKLCSKYHIFR